MPIWRSQTSTDLGQSLNHGQAQLPMLAGKRYLPQPRGPHSVGFIDFMTPGDHLEGSFVRILYPTKEQCLKEHDRWPVWTEDKYLTGMLTFMQAMLERWPSWAPKNEYLWMEQISVISPFIPRVGFPTIFRLANGQVYVPIIKDAVPDTSQKWPLVVFSHGLGCARSTYSRICYDLASYGFIVAAVEHRDGTACSSYFINDEGHEVRIPHRRVLKEEDEYALRNGQVRQRAKEVSNALDLMLDLKNKPVNILEQEQSCIHLSYLANAMDAANPLIAGHSFGGATTVLSLINDSRFKAGIALDAWLFPLRDEVLKGKISQPLLFISTDSFRSPENLEKMSELKEDSSSSVEHVGNKQFLYIHGSVHQNHIDAPFVVGHHLVRKIIGLHSKTCPEKVIDVNNKMMVQFMWKILGKTQDDEIESDLRKEEHLIRNIF